LRSKEPFVALIAAGTVAGGYAPGSAVETNDFACLA
jgi:hypothetical protein